VKDQVMSIPCMTTSLLPPAIEPNGSDSAGVVAWASAPIGKGELAYTSGSHRVMCVNVMCYYIKKYMANIINRLVSTLKIPHDMRVAFTAGKASKSGTILSRLVANF